MLAGRPPFTDDDAIVVMARHIKTMPRSLRDVAPDARIPAEVEGVVMRVLCKEPDGRPATADALSAELTRARESSAASSGVRATVRDGVPGVGAVQTPLPRSAPATPDALTSDTLSAPVAGGSKRRPWTVRVGVASGIVVSLAALAVVLFLPRRPAVSVSKPHATASAAQSTEPLFPSAPSAGVPATAWLEVPSVSPSASSRSSPHPPAHPDVRPPRTGRPAGTSRPVGSASVGYGYLE